MHQKEAAGAVGVLGVPLVKAALAEQGRLLVPGQARDGYPDALELRVPVDGAGGAHFRQHGPGDVQRLQERVVPAQAVDVIEHGAGGVGVVRGVDGAAGELPEEPGVHSAEEDLPLPGPLPGAGDLVQDPLDLGGGEVGVRYQARDGADMLP